MLIKKSVLLIFSLCLVVASCAPNAKEIKAVYVSPQEYSSYSCSQLSKELSRIGGKIEEITGVQNNQSSKDKIAFGTGLVIFWPALFFMVGDDQKEELSRLKGEYEAVEKRAIQKDC